MVSSLKVDANRCNAFKSTGPVSDAGKARSAMNARKRGFYCDVFRLGDEREREEFESLKEEVLAALRPRDVLERWTAEQVVVVQWRLRCLEGLDTGDCTHAEMGKWEARVQRLIGVVTRLLRQMEVLKKRGDVGEEEMKNEATTAAVSEVAGTAACHGPEGEGAAREGATVRNEANPDAGVGVNARNEAISDASAGARGVEVRNEPTDAEVGVRAVNARNEANFGASAGARGVKVRNEANSAGGGRAKMKNEANVLTRAVLAMACEGVVGG